MLARKHARVILHAATRSMSGRALSAREKREQQVRAITPLLRRRRLTGRVRLPRQVSQEEIADFAEAP